MFFQLAESSNQTTVSNIIGGSNNVSTILKGKRADSIDVTDHTPSTFSSKKRGAKSGVLTDVTNVLPTASTLPFQLRTPSTNGSCVTKISTKGKYYNSNNYFKIFSAFSAIGYFFWLETRQFSAKGKGKVLDGDNKFKNKTTTKSWRKTLEAQFDGCVNDNSSSEDDEDQAYQCDYEGLHFLLFTLALLIIYLSKYRLTNFILFCFISRRV